MDAFELSAKLTFDSKEFDEGLEKSKQDADGLSAKSVAMGQVVADAFEKMISKAIEFGKEIIDIGSQTEVALAKVDTIMDQSVMSSDAMANGIKKLSNEMGISVTDLSDSVYNAISATGDTEHALKLVESASKLATAGFTDTGSALSVLSTAMNAYGLSAEEVTNISDSMIQVQNLGVTTVGELSSSMGKAIAGASAYGVNLGNLESAYVSLTKNGINTAESTTMLNAMFKELGKDGSDVSDILKEKTGKSFGQLMADGYTLADVLGILNDSVDGNSEALKNLWSSAEAGNASSAIVAQGLDTFNSNLEQITSTTGATETAYATMADTMQHKIEVLKTNWENLKVTIFEKVAPAFEKLIEVGGYLIDHLDEYAPILAGVTAALTALGVGFGIYKMVELFTTAMSALGAVIAANPLGAILVAIVAIGTALYTLWNTNEEFRNKVIELWNKLKETVGKAIEAIKGFFGDLGGKIKEEWETIKESVGNAIEGVKGFFDGLGEKAGELKDNLAEKWEGIKTKVSDTWEGIKSKTGEVWGAIKGSIESHGGGIQGIIGTYMEGVKTIWGGAFDAVNQLTGGKLGEVAGKVGQKLSDIRQKFVDAFEKVKSTVKGAIDRIKSMFNFNVSLPHIKLPHFTISPSGWQMGDLLKGKIPTLGISWYAKAMNAGMILDQPTIFGIGSNGNLLGGGEAGAEAVVGVNSLERMIQNAVNSAMNGGVTYTQNVYVNKEVATADELARAIRTESRYGLMKGVALG